MTRTDPLQLYDLERHLLEDVAGRFHATGSLSAFDFFLIVIWKSNRAKTYMAKRLLAGGHGSIEEAVRVLTGQLHCADTRRERMRILVQVWGFQLPMASAVLTILYSDDFTVYDVRACNSLGAFHNLANKSAFDSIWRGYEEFCRAVRNSGPDGLSLRDKDRHLWATSFAEQLEADIQSNFGLG